MKKHVLFLCTGNACRSQMAEAIVNHMIGDEWEASSAGIRPVGSVHPMAIRVLNEIGISHIGRSKSVDEFRSTPFDLVFTVCDSASEECPVWLGQGRRVHVSFPDPAKVRGSDEEILQAFRNVRDQIQQQVPRLLRDDWARQTDQR